MAKYSLDTCVIISGFLEDMNCSKLVDRFIREKDESRCFITPTIKMELREKGAEFSSFINFLKPIIKEKGCSLSGAISIYKKSNNTKSQFVSEMANKYSELIDHFDKEKNRGMNLEIIRKRLDKRFARFHREDIPILPRDEYEKKDSFKSIKEKISEKELAEGDNDRLILAELVLISRISGEEIIEFYTLNLKDFKNKDDEWLEVCKDIAIKSPYSN